LNLGDALGHYVSSHQGQLSQEAQVELHRFVRWGGLDRDAQELKTHEVSDYSAALAVSGGNVLDSLTSIKKFLSFLKKEQLVSYRLAGYARLPRTKSAVQLRKREDEPIHLTLEGYNSIQSELGRLKSQRPEISEDIRRAAADKDVRENAPLDAARERQGHAESRIREIEHRLRHAVVLEENGRTATHIGLGHKILLHNSLTGKDVSYTLVDPAEADPLRGRISVASPVGKALLGQAAGQDIRVVAPKGDLLYHIVEIE
jgi:transcription elongation factor GreA